MRVTAGALLFFANVALGACAIAACAIGPEQEPGCHTDADCPTGWTCTAGACFHTTTPTDDPPADAGDAG